MAKSRTEKIASYDEQIAALQKKRSEELDKQKQEEKDEREKRQRKRGEILEKLIPETVNLTVEQFTALLNKTTANSFGRDKLAEILKASEAKPNPQTTSATPPQSPPNNKPTPQQSTAEKPNQATATNTTPTNAHVPQATTTPQSQRNS